MAATATTVAQTSAETLTRHAQASTQMSERVGQTLDAFSQNFERSAQALVEKVSAAQTAQQALQSSADEQRLQAWQASLAQMAAILHSDWQSAGVQTLAQQQAICDTLSRTAQDITTHTQTQATQTLAEITRLIETASEAPKAAAEVMGQLRQEISVSVARDNALLEERTRILDTLSTLLDAIHHASTEQRSVIDAMVTASQTTLSQTSGEFHEHVAAETSKLGDIAAHVTASAVDVASLAETFGFAVRSFSETNEKLMSNLQRIEQAIEKSMTRSDEQLAYYVAQAREMIDLSIGSQKDVLEALQQRQAEGAA
jgi:DNA anti-recombination protein RmuC